MKKILAAVFMFLGMIFQGASAPPKEGSTTGYPDQQLGPETERETQKVEEQKFIQSRLRGLGYFQ